jgi:hypothetical protein
MAKLLYRLKELPPYDSEFCQELANKLWWTKSYLEWARRPLLEYWREADNAYLCYRQLPHNEGMQWTDKSDFGATDIFDGVNQLATRLSLAMMPKDDSWLTAVSRQGDDPMIVTSIQQHQIWMHNRAHTRRALARHVKQLMVRGTSAIYIGWEHREKQRRLSTAEGRKRLKAVLKASGVDGSKVNAVDDIYESIPEYIGPRIRVIDSLDLYLDPAHDLSVDRKTQTIIATFRRLADLQNETDRDGKPLYSNLEGLEPFTPTEIYMKDIEGSNRILNLNTMGVFPQNQPYRNEGLVPVYVCYMPFYECQGEKFYDTYFHIAETRQGRMPRIIRIEQNPSQEGSQFIIRDTMIDWFGNTAYGISVVEKLLAKYNQKNVLEALTLEAALTSIFPAYSVISGALRDDTGISFSPGKLNEVSQNPLGLKYIEPIPVPQTGNNFGLQDIRFWGEQIASGFSDWTGFQDNPTRSLSTRETATAANIKATSGSLAIDELVEKFSVSLQEICQTVFDLSRQELEPDAKGNIGYQAFQNGRAQDMNISWADFQQPRDILISGLHGQFNRAQEIQNMTEALKGMAQIANILPNASALAQPIVLRLLDKMNIEIPPEAKLDPVQLASKDPRVLQLAAQTPQAQQLAVQQLMQQHPQLAAALQSLMGGGGPSQRPQGQPAIAGGGAVPGNGRPAAPTLPGPGPQG